MLISKSLPKQSESYQNHPVFDEIKYMMNFYESVSDTCMRYIPQGVLGIMNYASYIYLALKGTLDSIQLTLREGRMTDAFTLLRKLFDDVLVEIYIDVTRKEKFDWENNFYVQDVEEWIRGKHRIPKLEKLLKILEKSPSTKDIYPFFGWDSYLKKYREYLDDSVHSNRFRGVLLNCNEVIVENRERELRNLSIVLKQIFLVHLAFIFHLNDHYFMATDFMDDKDMGLEPPEGCTEWIAPYAQEAFDKYIKPHAKLAEFIKNESGLKIE